MDYVYPNLLKVAEVEDLQDGHLGTVCLANKGELEAGETRTVKCIFHSKVIGVRATVLTECSHPLVKFIPCLQEIDLQTLS